MADQNETPVWNLSLGQWEAILMQARSSLDALEDGASVRVERNGEAEQDELTFFAAALNKPFGWSYPFLEAIPHSVVRGASIGRAWHDADTGLVQFEVSLPAAAQELAADYESGASDLDFVTYEQAVEQAVRGTAYDLAWLHQEFGRLAVLTVS
ncbi:MAG: hypothetical protein ACRYFS_04515 [Janthinobacterium lividum]